MSEKIGTAEGKAFAIIASIFLHVVVIGFFLLFCGDEPPPPQTKDVSSEVADATTSGDSPRESVQNQASADEQVATPSPTVPTPETTSSPVTRTRRTPPATTTPPEQTSEIPKFYVVQRGDTLTKIAKKYKTTPEELARVNGKSLKKLNLLWVGQKIKLRID